MSDLIDREQAKDAIDKYLVGRNLVTDGTFMARLINEIVIDRLPSALGTNLAEDGTDCISRQALLDKFEPWLKVKDYNDGELNMLKAVLYEIRFMRSAQPEIIRCRECKFASGDSRICMKFDHSPIGELDFCSFAERREVNNESN